jgi:hypothetical protein
MRVASPEDRRAHLMSRIRIAAAIAGATALLMSLSGTAAATDPPTVRLWNVISTKVTVDLLIDGQAVLDHVPYGTVSDSVAIAPGSHDILLRDSTTHGNLSVTGAKFPNGSSTTVALYYPTGANAWRDELQTNDEAALLRVFAVTPKTKNTSPTAVVEGSQKLGEIPYFTNPTDYFPLAPGTHHLQLVNKNGNAFFHFRVTVEAGTNYTAFIWDDNGTTRANLVVDAESASNTAVGMDARNGANSLLGLGVLVIGFACWLGLSRAGRRKGLG